MTLKYEAGAEKGRKEDCEEAVTRKKWRHSGADAHTACSTQLIYPTEHPPLHPHLSTHVSCAYRDLLE
jgi:hypothetical protein